MQGPNHPHSMWANIELPEKIDQVSHLEIDVTGWDKQSFSKKIPIDFSHVPNITVSDKKKPDKLKKSAQPPTGNVFYGFVWGYVLLSSCIAIGWVVLDRK